MFEPEVFRKHMFCIEDSTCDIVGSFRRPPQSFGARGIVSPPFITPLVSWLQKGFLAVVMR